MAAVVANLVVVSVAVTCRVRHLAARRAKGSDGARPPARSRPLRINEWLRLHLPARINMCGRSCTEMHASAALRTMPAVRLREDALMLTYAGPAYCSGCCPRAYAFSRSSPSA